MFLELLPRFTGSQIDCTDFSRTMFGSAITVRVSLPKMLWADALLLEIGPVLFV